MAKKGSIRKTLPVKTVQKAIGTVAKSIAVIETKLAQTQEPDASKKLNKELVSLANSMASLGRLLSQNDKDRVAERAKKTSSLY